VNTPILASIDIGTNTFRLLIAAVHHDESSGIYSIDEIYSERKITRIGEGLKGTGRINADALERSLAVLQRFRDFIADQNVCAVSAVATSALREAKNSSLFLQEVKKNTGIDIEIISGEREAELTISGMLLDMIIPRSAFMIDIGGGSTELSVVSCGSPVFKQSLHLGVVYLAGSYMKHDPPFVDDIKGMEHEIIQRVAEVRPPLRSLLSSDTVLIGTAGTVTTLSAVAQKLSSFDHQRIHNSTLSLKTARKIFSDIATIHSRDRARYIPFEPERLDIIVPGTLILLTLMEMFSFDEIRVSNYGLREGNILELYKSMVGSQ